LNIVADKVPEEGLYSSFVDDVLTLVIVPEV
jgi:hypothetical protein